MRLVGLGIALWVLLQMAHCSWIWSSKVTNWGDWGPIDQCPPNMFVNGIQVKAQSYQGPNDDDSSLNGVKLSCIGFKYPDDKAQIPYPIQATVNSSVMEFGDWRPWSYCVEGIAIGFELLSEPNQGGGDDSAANDMKLTCANHSGLHTTEEHGEKFGSWTGVQRCPNYTAVCGIQTQVEPNQGTGDDSALNNVGLMCCDLPNPAKVCKSSDEWESMMTRNISTAESPACISIQVKYGVSHTHISDNGIDQVSAAAGFGTGVEFLSLLGKNFETSLSNSITTDYYWSTTKSSIWKNEREESKALIIYPHCNTTLLQVIGKCGPYTVKVKKLKRVDACVNGTVVSGVSWQSAVCPGKSRASVGVAKMLFLGLCLTTHLVFLLLLE